MGTADLCEMCEQRPAQDNACNGDGSLHSHGAIHINGMGLMRVCASCCSADWAVWNNQKETVK